MRKALLVAASALIIASTVNANAMTLGSVRPNIIRAAALGQPDLAVQRTSLTMLISWAASAFEQMRQFGSASNAATPSPQDARLDI